MAGAGNRKPNGAAMTGAPNYFNGTDIAALVEDYPIGPEFLRRFEAISRDGEEELARSALSLWWSALAAGLAISMSVLGKAFFYESLPEAPWRGLVSNLGYAFGFLIVILGRMQLPKSSTGALPLVLGLHRLRLLLGPRHHLVESLHVELRYRVELGVHLK